MTLIKQQYRQTTVSIKQLYSNCKKKNTFSIIKIVKLLTGEGLTEFWFNSSQEISFKPTLS